MIRNHFRIAQLLALPLLFILIFHQKQTFGQSEETMLGEVVQIYNEAKSTVDEVRTRQRPAALMDSIRDISETAMERLRILKLSSNPAIAINARYFYMNFQYNFAFGYAAIDKSEAAHKYMTALISDMNYFDESKFPLRYTKGGTNYIIKYEDFKYTRCEFYVAYAELSYNSFDYTTSLDYVKKAEPLLNNQWLSYVCFYFGIKSKEKLSQYDAECIHYCSKQLYAYYNLSDASVDTIMANNYGTYRMATTALDKSLENGISNQSSYNELTEAIQILKYYMDPYKEKDESQRKKNKFILLRWYHEAVMITYSSKEFVKGALQFSEIYADSYSNDKPTWLSRYEKFDLNCNDYQFLIDQYNQLSDSAAVARLTPNLTTCKEKEAKAAAQAEADRKKTEKKNSKSGRRSNGQPLFYAGINLFPLIAQPRDLGLALNFGGSHMVTEFSYLQVNSKPENYFDLSLKDVNDVPEHRWDGYYAHINLKFPTDNGWDDGQFRPYAGFLLAYNQRTFDAFPIGITQTATNLYTTKTIAPTSSQVSGMVNFGFMGVRGFGIDLFMGFGAAYNKFDNQVTEYSTDEYFIDDALIENRPAEYWSFIMRMGVSIGIGFAKD
jgi:hypothetical protein